ncbi:hypothetical protein BDV3_002097 [Batrachochytrium dendrobatidis]
MINTYFVVSVSPLFPDHIFLDCNCSLHCNALDVSTDEQNDEQKGEDLYDQHQQLIHQTMAAQKSVEQLQTELDDINRQA